MSELFLQSGETASVQEIAAAYSERLQDRFGVGKRIKSPSDTKEFLKAELACCERELFGVMFLDNRHRIIGFEIVFSGTIDATAIYPREVVKAALRNNAAAIILAHNHPSGIPEPSEADRLITRRLRDACELVDVRLLDHMVVGGDECVSLASRGDI